MLKKMRSLKRRETRNINFLQFSLKSLWVSLFPIMTHQKHIAHADLMVLAIFQKAMTFDHNFSY